MSALIQDLRHALRLVRRQPVIALTAVLTLALGVGANTAIFSVVQAVLLRPLPLDEPDRLVLLWETQAGRGVTRNVANPGNVLAWRERNRSFTGVAAFARWQANLWGEAGAERVPIGYVTDDFFSVLGARPQLGRAFLPSDGANDAPHVVVLSAGLWRQRFAADPGVVGRTLTMNGQPATIVGVMPDSFDLPTGARWWSVLPLGERQRAQRGRYLSAVARLRPGVGLAEARADLASIALATERERPDFNAGWSATAAPLHADIVRDVRPALGLLLAAVALVLAVACANVANLLLAQAARREKELALRAALGAGLGRLARQLLAETLLLAAAGAAAGLLLARWMLDGLVALLPAEIPAFMQVRLDVRVLLFALALAASAALLSGLLPVVRLRRPGLTAGLHDAGGAGVRRDRRRAARGLIVCEIALAGVLLVGAALVVRSFERLLATSPGFDAGPVTTFQVSLDEAYYPEPAAQARFHAQAVEGLAALPSTASAAGMSWQLLGMGSATGFELADRPAPPAGEEPVADVRFVTPRLFETLGIPLLAGRDFDARDGSDRPRVVIVNESLARRYWPGRSALGQRIRMGWGEVLEAEVVGVVGDVRMRSLDQGARETLYWHVAQVPSSFMTFFVRSPLPTAALAPAVRETMSRVDARVPVADLQPLRDVVWASVERPLFVFVLASAFGLTAVLLAGVGLFGVIAESVAQRRREMAVRRALGARGREIVGLVLSEGLALSAAGLLLGLALARVLARFLESQLFATAPGSPEAYAAAALLTLSAALVALLVPARRALAADPAQDLRAE